MKKIIIVLILAFNFSYALDQMYDYRYTHGPEIVVPDAFFVGAGGWTRYANDLYLIGNIQVGITDRFEIGAKYIGGYDRGDLSSLIDIGAKFAISRNLALQVDVPFDGEWGGVLSISQWDGYTKNVSFIYEGRLGFARAAGEDRYVKPSLAFFPFFQIGNAFRLSVGTLCSFGIGKEFDYFKEDFMMDLMPRVEFGILHLRFMGEISIGIITWEAKKRNRYALFITTDI
ncbi:MAG: hypothetical protein LBC75_04255 [Fibromonadaceae bacterium]|jgi:hypothetical protein|nr:hypothetical protein [Fibromonadaceae bacterium]